MPATPTDLAGDPRREIRARGGVMAARSSPSSAPPRARRPPIMAVYAANFEVSHNPTARR